MDLTNEEEINLTIQNTWKDFESILIATAFNYLYCEKKTPKSRFYNKKTGQSKTESYILQIYHKTCKIVRSWTNLTNKHITSNQLQRTWNILNQVAKIIEPFLPEFRNMQQFQDSITGSKGSQLLEQIKETLPALREAYYREEKKRTDKEIKEAIQDRCSNLKLNQKKIVRTLTNNFQEKITIDRIKISDEEGQEFITI